MHNFFSIYYACIINFYIFEAMKKQKSIDHELRATWQAIAKMYNEQAVKHESTMSTAFVLLNIDSEKGTPSTALGPLMGMEPTSLSRILKNMEDKGAISREKNPDDGRSVIIKLTPYGKEMRSVSKGHVYQFNNKVKEYITEEELENFFKVTSTINKLIANKKVFEGLQLKAI
jgi:DNA-binding MarR family transcriptional regulator